MAENKTQPTKKSIQDFIAEIVDPGTRKDCTEIAAMMAKISGEPGVMWGPSIVGFGSYHYKYASGREGDSMLIGFSPRKQNITFYLCGVIEQYADIMSKLGKYKTGKGCLYIKSLGDVDRKSLEKLIALSCDYMRNYKWS